MRRRWIVLMAAVASLSLVAAACGGSDPEPVASESPAATETSTKTITDVVASNPDFSTLLAAVQAAGLGETLAGEGPYTVFAPTDEAFAALPEGTLDSLLQPKNKEQLTGILTYHVVDGKVMAADVQPGDVTTLNGGSFAVSVEDGNVVLTDASGGTAQVVQTDVPASNGVIHVIDAVLLP